MTILANGSPTAFKGGEVGPDEENFKVALFNLDSASKDWSTEDWSNRISNPNLREFSVTSCAISSDTLRLLLTGLDTTNLRRIRFQSTPLTLADVKTLSFVLSDSLVELAVNDCGLTDEGLKLLTKGVTKRGEQLQKLSLENNRLSDSGVLSLTSSLHSTSLRELFLSGNHLSNKSLAYLGGAIELSSLETLYVEDHPQFTGEGVVAFAERIPASKLKLLSVNGCSQIGDSGAIALFEACAKPSTMLVVANLNGCGLTDTSVMALEKLVTSSSARWLEIVRLSNNPQITRKSRMEVSHFDEKDLLVKTDYEHRNGWISQGDVECKDMS